MSLLGETSPLPEKIVKRKTVVYKSRIDPTVIKLTAEKMKSRLFTKAGLFKPGPEEIRVVSIERSYEPYVVVDGRYRVDYFKKRVFTFDIGNEASGIKILDEDFEPEILRDVNGTRKVVRIEGEERRSYEDKAYLILDSSGREVSPDVVPSAPCEEHPTKVLKEHKHRVEKLDMSPAQAIDAVRSKIVNRPADLEGVGDEVFEVSEFATIYSPIFEITFRNVGTGEEKSVKVDGVTAKIIA